MRKRNLIAIVIMSMCMFVGCGVSQEEYDILEKEKSAVQTQLDEKTSSLQTLEKEYEQVKATNETQANELKELQKKYDELNGEYTKYKEKMKPYEELDAAEAEARLIAAQKEKEAEEARKKAEEEEAARKAEEEAKKGYDTGIKYNELARTPDDYLGKKVKFSGKVIQVIEGDGEVQIRFAVNSNYDTVLFGVYDSDIVSSRVLEDDKITIYGKSTGLLTYQSTMGGDITIPSVRIEKIDQ